MRFDPRRTVFLSDGALDTFRHLTYQEALGDAFSRSPEGRALGDDIGLTLCDALVHCLHEHHGTALPDLDASELRRLTLETLPRFVSLDSDDAPALLRTWSALFRWLDRAHGLRHAKACLAFLDEADLAAQLESAILDPALETVRPTMWLFRYDESQDLADAEP